jgi:hypothetical protein
MYLRSHTHSRFRLGARESAVDELRRGRSPRATGCRAWPAAPAVRAAQAEIAHQPRDTLPPDALAMGDPQLGMHARGAVDRERPVIDLADQPAEPRILDRARRRCATRPDIEA